jgi:hypothetical protein
MRRRLVGQLLPVMLASLLILCILLQVFLVTQLSSILDTASSSRRSIGSVFHFRHKPATTTTEERSHDTILIKQPKHDKKNDDSSSIYQSTINASSPYAYVFLLAGCNTDNPLSYLGFLYTIMVSAEVLKGRSSTADLILMVQMDSNSPQSTLPEKEQQWLHSLGIHLQYIPPRRGNAFYYSQYLKFEVLKLTQYERILYMDADAMPLCNLDYLFELSSAGILRKHVLLAWWNEPASGGFFLMTPSQGDYEELHALVEAQERQVAIQNDFDGWGTLQGKELPDNWRGTPPWPAVGETIPAVKGIVSNQWRWPGSFCDQGLLYYWTKYHQKDVSIINIDTFEHWGKDGMGNLVRERVEDNSVLRSKSCLADGMETEGHFGSNLHPMFIDKVPYRDFVHFTSSLKPWKQPTMQYSHSPPEESSSSTEFWVSVLHELEQRFDNMKIDWKGLAEAQSPLGEYPKLTDMIRAGRKLLHK